MYRARTEYVQSTYIKKGQRWEYCAKERHTNISQAVKHKQQQSLPVLVMFINSLVDTAAPVFEFRLMIMGVPGGV